MLRSRARCWAMKCWPAWSVSDSFRHQGQRDRLHAAIARRAFDQRDILDFALADFNVLFAQPAPRRQDIAFETAHELVVMIDRAAQPGADAFHMFGSDRQA